MQEILQAGTEGAKGPLVQGTVVLSLYTAAVVALCARLMRRLASAR